MTVEKHEETGGATVATILREGWLTMVPMPRLPAVLLCISSLPLAIRLSRMWEAGTRLRTEDLASAGMDIAVGVLASLLLVGLCRFHKMLLVFGGIVWMALNVGYYEFLHEFDSPYFLIHAAYLLDGDFMRGSGLSLRHPVLAVAWFAVILAGSLYLSRRAPGRFLIAAGLGAMLLLAALQFFPGIPEIAAWRQRDFMSNNLADLSIRLLAHASEGAEPADLPVEAAMVFLPDLSGVSVLPEGDRSRRNVLLVMVEGANGGHLPLNASYHGLDNQLVMPELDSIARKTLSWSTFLTHQRQSNRGIYALLCGDFPRLGEALPKMTEVANGARKTCLPEVLRSHGYQTLFLKSGELDFMLMDQFMKKARVDRSLGANDFDPAVPRAKWGVMDEDLYRRALVELKAMRAAGRPWFATLFTVSTHHPFEVPASFKAMPDASPRVRAWSYADTALAGFLDALAGEGMLSDTLVLVSSDEASIAPEKMRTRPEELQSLVENWGLLVALAPEGTPIRIDEPYQQSDMALSVLDYLGFENPDGAFIGRSLFRRYASSRPLYFANLYKNRIHELAANGRLTGCDEALRDCRSHDASGRLFSAGVKPLGPIAVPQALKAVKARTMQLLPLPF